MDSMITAAAHALATGDVLGALKRVALREDAPALALRGIAMAQLGDLDRAKAAAAARGAVPSARKRPWPPRCVVAEAEIALVSRDLGWPAKHLTLRGRRWRRTAIASMLRTRERPRSGASLLIGHLDEAEHALAGLDAATFLPASKAAHRTGRRGIAMRRLRIGIARAALAGPSEPRAQRTSLP